MTKFSQIIALILLVFFLTAGPAQARKSFLEGLMPFLYDRGDENIPPPEETLQAPFAYDPSRDFAQEGGLPQNAIAIDQPHRNEDDIARWTVTAVSDALTFPDRDYREKLETVRQNYFIPAAARQYQEFLQANRVVNILEGGRFRVQSFAQGRPLLLNDGPLQGHYRWLYEMEIMISYFDRLEFDYRENKPVNQQYTLLLQVGRQATGGHDGEGIKIESWAVKE